MGRYRLELATEADDAGLRAVLARTPMQGQVSLSFRREPSYFDAAVVDGRFRQIVVARETGSGSLVGFGSRSVGERFVNGARQPVGYLSSLRILAEHRRGTLLARGYRFFRDLHEDGRAKVYVTTIAADNEPAMQSLAAGRAGMPVYSPAGMFLTVAIPLGRRGLNGHAAHEKMEQQKTQIRCATAADWPMVAEFLEREGPGRQFFPCYSLEDFGAPSGAFRDLEPQRTFLAFRDERLIGMLAAWDQSRFRQTVIEGYGQPLRWLRGAYNAWASVRGEPRLPAAPQKLRYLTAALPVVEGGDPQLFELLLRTVWTACAGQSDYLFVGLHQRDPLSEVLLRQRGRQYAAQMYVVHWPDGAALRENLDDRPPYLELGHL